MARKPAKLPDYFTSGEASALVAAAPSYQVRMGMRIMLRADCRCPSARLSGRRTSDSAGILLSLSCRGAELYGFRTCHVWTKRAGFEPGAPP